MIDIENQVLVVPGYNWEPIEEWKVWFVTVEGTFATLPEAIESAKRIGQPPQTIVPVAVACGATTYEVSLRQGYAEEPEEVPFDERFPPEIS